MFFKPFIDNSHFPIEAFQAKLGGPMPKYGSISRLSFYFRWREIIFGTNCGTSVNYYSLKEGQTKVMSVMAVLVS